MLRAVTTTVQNKLRVAIAEVDHQALWQRAALGVSCVAESGGHCRKVLQEVEKAIGRSAVDGAEIVDRDLRVVALEDL